MAKIMIPNLFNAFIELLEKNAVRYLIVGGYAVAYRDIAQDFAIYSRVAASDFSRGA